MTGTKDTETPVRNPRNRNAWDIEGKLFAEDKWSLCGRYGSLEAAEASYAGFVERAGTQSGDCMFYSFVRLMAPRHSEPVRSLIPSTPTQPAGAKL